MASIMKKTCNHCEHNANLRFTILFNLYSNIASIYSTLMLNIKLELSLNIRNQPSLFQTNTHHIGLRRVYYPACNGKMSTITCYCINQDCIDRMVKAGKKKKTLITEIIYLSLYRCKNHPLTVKRYVVISIYFIFSIDSNILSNKSNVEYILHWDLSLLNTLYMHLASERTNNYQKISVAFYFRPFNPLISANCKLVFI